MNYHQTKRKNSGVKDTIEFRFIVATIFLVVAILSLLN
jgi:hypothetical protein